MRLATFSSRDGEVGIGWLDNGQIHAIALSGGSVSMLDFISSSTLDQVLAVEESPPRSFDAADVSIHAPIPRPRRNIFCVGKNYRAHADEFHRSGFDSTSQDCPEAPIFFTKATTAVIGPGDTIRADLDPTGTVDYEGELAVIIGVGGHRISAEDAHDHIFGYTAMNDVTSRELQRSNGQWFLGKSIDTFAPMGPCIVTRDEIGDPSALEISLDVNGEIRQVARLSDLIFGVPALIEALSRVVSLEPGDIIATGTPAGVGIGFQPPRYLASGDKVTVEITRIGQLSNPVSG
jgi:2-keto-4-pentenoate hydratase/2-oxohepta-3-ene-1,7-dioic acid hydratase in catechol pathway